MAFRLTRWLSVAATLILFLSVAVTPSDATGKRGAPSNEHELLVYGLIRQVQTQADGFEKVLKPSLKVSVFRHSSNEKELLDRAGNIAFGAHEVRKHFEERQSSDAIRPEICDMFVAAERLNFVVSNVQLVAPAVESWSQLRNALNNLGAAYGLKPLSTDSYVAETL